MAKQCKFIDTDGVVRGGILEDGDIICGCCGGYYHKDVILTSPMKENGHKMEDGYEVEILEVFDDWADISNEIAGV